MTLFDAVLLNTLLQLAWIQ